MVVVDGGPREIGAPGDGFAYDNERPRQRIDSAAFRIDRRPVSNRDFAAFVAETGTDPPLYWEGDGAGGWVSTTFGRRAELDPEAPVIHVDHRQAGAFAAWAGKRLPSEFEWELAAAGSDPATANLDHAAFGCRPPADGSASSCNAEAMLGDVWEWTSSELAGYPGFEPFPYPEYSEVFFGRGYPVLRGGSWATRRNVDPHHLPQLGPPRAPADLRRLPLRRGSLDGRRDDRDRGRPAGRRRARRHGRGRARGPLVSLQGAAAEVLLRRARLGALRADHRTAGVLPDPLRARDPARASGRDRRGGAAADADRARLRRRRQEPRSPRRDARRPARSSGSSRSISPRRSPAGPPASSSTSTRGSRSRASSATTRPTSSGSPGPRGR